MNALLLHDCVRPTKKATHEIATTNPRRQPENSSLAASRQLQLPSQVGRCGHQCRNPVTES
eukprot:343507-Prymnesium_polylepis.1